MTNLNYFQSIKFQVVKHLINSRRLSKSQTILIFSFFLSSILTFMNSSISGTVSVFEELKQFLYLNCMIDNFKSQVVNRVNQEQLSNNRASLNKDQDKIIDLGIDSQQNYTDESSSQNSESEINKTNRDASSLIETEDKPQISEEHNSLQLLKQKLISKEDHRIALSDLKEKYNTNFEYGLTSEQVIQNRLQYGSHTFTESKQSNDIVKAIINGFSIMLYISIALCIFVYYQNSAYESYLYLALVILIVNHITIMFTKFIKQSQRYYLNQSDNKQGLLTPKCLVIRDENLLQINRSDLVVGDIVKVKCGEYIPADIRILESSEMKIDSSKLSGAHKRIFKSVECSHPENYLETSNVAFFNSLCVEGIFKGVVISTGINTVYGQIQLVLSSEKRPNSSFINELDRFVKLTTIATSIICTVFFFYSHFVVGFSITSSVTLVIHTMLACIPEGLLVVIILNLAISCKKQQKYHNTVMRLESVETLGSVSCICSNISGSLTQNVKSVKRIWVNDKVQECTDCSSTFLNRGQAQYDINDPDFKRLQQAAILSSSENTFSNSVHENPQMLNNLGDKVINDATEEGLIRFYQQIEDVNQLRSRFKVVKNPDGSESKMPFNPYHKFSLTVVEEESEDSHYSVYIKGAPETILSFCSQIFNKNEAIELNDNWKQKIEKVYLSMSKCGERVLGLAKLPLPAILFPQGSHFQVQNPEQFPFELTEFQFCGLISLIDPINLKVPKACLELRQDRIKIILITGDHPATATAIARQANVIPQGVITTEELIEANPELDWYTASEKSEVLIVHGERITESFERSRTEKREHPNFYLRQWAKKPYCIFARITPAQKLLIIEAFQAEEYVVAQISAGGSQDRVNDSPALKKADVGISMNNKLKNDATIDVSDMIFNNNDFSSVVIGIEQGRLNFDNLKKSLMYLLTPNIADILACFAFIFFQIPLPFSGFLMLILHCFIDIYPAVALAYERKEFGSYMERRHCQKSEHVCSVQLFSMAYFSFGLIESAGAFMGYFVMFNYLGFPISSLSGLANASGYKPLINDFSSPVNPKTGQADPYFNQALYEATGNQYDCRVNTASVDSVYYHLDWEILTEGNYDLRKSLLKCNQNTGDWEPQIQWSFCSIDSKDTLSSVTRQTACYSTEALKWAQSAFLISIILCQFSNIFVCKNRKASYAISSVNINLLYSILIQVVALCFFLYTPQFQIIFGSRPCSILVFFYASPFSMFLLLLEEYRKYLCQNYLWFDKYFQW